MPSGSPFAKLPGGLPPGRLIEPDEDYADDPTWSGHDAIWVSDEQVPEVAPLWRRLYASRAETGLYPLLLEGLDGEPDRPWHVGELGPAPVGTIDVLTAGGVLRRFWDAIAPDDEDEEEPFPGLPDGMWAGLAEPGEGSRDPDAAALELVEVLASVKGWLLGLVPAARGADALTLAGWDGPCNHTNHTQEISAVLRSWEDRFGVRVVSVGFATLQVSVAAPPVTYDHALRVAAEHHAFCPDNIWQGGGSAEEYAKGLIGADQWSFWWD
ncbi:DUF4253 domain-containing protein [Actinomadura viridis]|uniref:DUF4253 domain-containing protein n=1 Tax=Actinomadura viridis TaxID=58110 RepID=UPI0036A0A297